MCKYICYDNISYLKYKDRISWTHKADPDQSVPKDQPDHDMHFYKVANKLQ